MSGLEDRLRDAIRSATETVSPAAAENVEQSIRQRIGQAKPLRTPLAFSGSHCGGRRSSGDRGAGGHPCAI